ncbi:hypothetical protein BH09SUM1_BH09SUM1_33140 [soil metagenome]
MRFVSLSVRAFLGISIVAAVLGSSTTVEAKSFCFARVRRIFPLSDARETTASLSLGVALAPVAQPAGDRVRTEVDAAPPKQFAEERSLLQLEASDDGVLSFTEQYTTQDGHSVTRSYSLNYHSEASHDRNVALAFYPYIYLDKRFVQLLGDEVPFDAKHPAASAKKVGPDWNFETVFDPETHLPRSISERDNKSNRLWKKVDYHWAAVAADDGLPDVVRIRTFEGDEKKPVAELLYKRIPCAPPAGPVK